MEILYIVSHACITVLAVAGLALRIEHRLTRIETDVTWLKRNVDNMCKRGDCNEDDSKVDQT